MDEPGFVVDGRVVVVWVLDGLAESVAVEGSFEGIYEPGASDLSVYLFCNLFDYGIEPDKDIRIQ